MTGYRRTKPYTEAGLRRRTCYRCPNQATTQWQICADHNTYRPLCTPCDIALNALVLRWMHHPDAEQLIADYADGQRATTTTPDDKRARFQADPDDPRHGTKHGYKNLGCRCDRCKAAYAQWQHDTRNAPPNIDPTIAAVAEGYMTGATTKNRRTTSAMRTPRYDGARDKWGRTTKGQRNGLHRRGRTPRKHPR